MRGNLADLAATGLASEPTLRKWISAQPDQPWIIKRGSNGDAYEIDFTGAVEAWRAEEQRKTDEARQRAEAVRQFGLDLGLGGGDQTAQVGLSIAERKQLLEEELVAMKIARERGFLVSKAEVDAAFADILTMITDRLSSFTARLAKKVELARDIQIEIDRQIDNDRADWANKMEQMSFDGDGVRDPGSSLDDTAV